MIQSLHFRFSMALVMLFVVIGALLVLLTRYSADRYYLELTQKLNAPIAMYVAAEAALIRHGVVDEAAMQSVAHKAMVINPTVEVYLLDTGGRVLGHNLGPGSVQQQNIDMSPIRHFLAGDADLPLLGDDPRHAGRQKIFTAAEVRPNGQLEGYVYAVLGGQKYEQLAEAAGLSDAMRISTLAIVACIAFGLGTALLVFRRLSRRIKSLTERVNRYCSDTMGSTCDRLDNAGDEIVQLSKAFDAMQSRIQSQITEIRDADDRRRELVANVSHDLRTPLTIMNGYLETLRLPQNTITPQQRQAHLDIAYQQGIRLDKLVTDLFELARLDSGVVNPQLDTFCLPELAADIVQEHRLSAQRKAVELRVERCAGPCIVCADIRLIERVITNLLDNAIRHTPARGRISLQIDETPGGIAFAITDSGEGIAAADLPRIFERGFSASVPVMQNKTRSGGLGLAIVKSILRLHDAGIEVRSAPHEGTMFRFVLAPGA
jgi:signal transduction histidine kinase